ncbi:MAG: CHASE3 domain-containing protein, partial [Pseudonocardiaceae bacterium]
MALSTTRKFSVGLLGVTALAVLFAGIAYVTIEKVSASSGWVAHTNRVLLTIEDIGSSLSAAESGQRGFLITGQTAYLEPYFAAREELPSRLAELRRLTSDNPRRQFSVDTLERTVAERMATVQASIDSAHLKGLEAGRAVVMSGRGREVMKGARHILQKLTDEERELLDDRLRDQRAGVERTRNVVTAGLALTVLLCAIGVFTII